MTNLLRSGFLWVTLALGGNIALSHYFDVFVWKLVAWLLLGAHLSSYTFVCLFMYMILAPVTDIIKSQKP